jgi:hypothetical protein
VVNRNGEFVGIISDGNIEGLVGRFIYDETSNRAVSVDSAAIIEALHKLYDAGPLAEELEGKAATAVRQMPGSDHARQRRYDGQRFHGIKARTAHRGQRPSGRPLPRCRRNLPHMKCCPYGSGR